MLALLRMFFSGDFIFGETIFILRTNLVIMVLPVVIKGLLVAVAWSWIINSSVADRCML